MQMHRWNELARDAGPPDLVHDGPVLFVDVVCYASRLPDPEIRSDWWQNLARYVELVCSETGTGIYFPAPFRDFDSASTLHPDRFRREEWENLVGIVGAQHLPNTTQGEPGDFNPLIDILIGRTPGDEDVLSIQTDLQTRGFYSGELDGEPSTDLSTATRLMATKYSELEELATMQAARLRADHATRMESAEVNRMAVSLDGAMRPVIRAIVLDELQNAGVIDIKRRAEMGKTPGQGG